MAHMSCVLKLLKTYVFPKIQNAPSAKKKPIFTTFLTVQAMLVNYAVIMFIRLLELFLNTPQLLLIYGFLPCI